jgi:MFS family permease
VLAPPAEAAVSIGHVVQLAVAPVFLLTGVSSLLGVLSNRLARIVDRARRLETLLDCDDPEQLAALNRLLHQQGIRARLISRAITLCIACAILVGGVVVTLFVSSLAELNLGAIVATLFVAAMMMLIASLLIFLREIYLATDQLRIGQPEGLPTSRKPGATPAD